LNKLAILAPPHVSATKEYEIFALDGELYTI